MRKAHEIQEDQIANFTNNDDDPVTVDCLLCGADMTKMTSGKEHRHCSQNPAKNSHLNSLKT